MARDLESTSWVVRLVVGSAGAVEFYFSWDMQREVVKKNLTVFLGDFIRHFLGISPLRSQAVVAWELWDKGFDSIEEILESLSLEDIPVVDAAECFDQLAKLLCAFQESTASVSQIEEFVAQWLAGAQTKPLEAEVSVISRPKEKSYEREMAAGITSEELRILVDQKKKNPIEDVKYKLSYFEGRDSLSTDACPSFDKWVNVLESITDGDVWDNEGRIKLAGERLRGDPLQTWYLWRKANVQDDWDALKREMKLLYSPQSSLYTTLTAFTKANRSKGEAAVTFFNRVKAAAAELIDRDESTRDLIENTVPLILLSELPEKFVSKQKWGEIRNFEDVVRAWNKWEAENPESLEKKKAPGVVSVAAFTKGATAEGLSGVENTQGSKAEGKAKGVSPDKGRKAQGAIQKAQGAIPKVSGAAGNGDGDGRGIKPRDERTCAFCGKAGHLMQACWKFQERITRGQSGSQGGAGNPLGEPRESSSSDRFSCYSCRKKGHFKKNCPNRVIKTTVNEVAKN